MLEGTHRTEHFRRNVLAWIALNHFLPAELFRELMYVVVDEASAGEILLNHLFDEKLFEGTRLQSWAIRPLETKTPLANYLQRRIRSLVWQHDADVHPMLEERTTNRKIGPEEIERAFFLGKQDLFSVPYALSIGEKLSEPGVDALVGALRHFAKGSAATEHVARERQTSQIFDAVEMPLRAILRKHIGDLCADADEWASALILYNAAEIELSDTPDGHWTQFFNLVRDAILQSKSSAFRMTRGTEEAAPIINESLDRATLDLSPVLLLNASHDGMVANILSAKSFDFGRDQRASILQTPQLLAAHHTSQAIQSWLDGKFLDAGQQFWAVLRRQTMLGSAQDSRITKAQYAQCLLEELEKTPESDRRTGVFWMGLRLLLESGQSEAAKKLPWNSEVLRSHLSEDLLANVVSHVSRHDGSRIERISVAIECFASWVPLLGRDQSHLARQMLHYLSEISKERMRSPWKSQSVDSRSIELLSEVAVKRPEFSAEVAKEVAGIVTAKLKSDESWRSKSDAIKLANAYIGKFADTDLVNVFEGVLAVLDATDPSKDQWPIVQTAMDMLMSDVTPRLSAADPERGARIIATILRFGLNQRSEHAHLLYFLQDFDFGSLRDESVVEKLQEVVQRVSTQAKSINASNAIYNVNAMLYASKLSGSEGVQVGLDALEQILKSAEADQANISFAIAYQSLDLLAKRRDLIASETSIPLIDLQTTLTEIFKLVVRVWTIARNRPLIFTVFSIPPATRPNSTLVQNWAYASISFAGSLDRRSEMLAAIAAAEAEPTLREPIALARATRLLVGDPEELTPETMQGETAAAFYAALGQRLLQLRSLDGQRRRFVVEAMLQKCLREGPQGLDAAVFLAAADCEVKPSTDDPEYEHYRVRLDNQRDLRLALFPMLNRLEG